MKTPSTSKTADNENTAGFLLLMNREGETQVRYIEKCDKILDRLREIRTNDSKLRNYLITYCQYAPYRFKDEDGNTDYKAWFKRNWVAVRAESRLDYFKEDMPDDVKLCRFWSDLQVNSDININAKLESKSVYDLKKKVKKKQKVSCPHCGKLQSRVNLSRHINHWCKGTSTNKG